MTRLARAAALPLMMFALTACPKGGAPDAALDPALIAALEGSWTDNPETSAFTEIKIVKGEPRVTRIVDYDGEEFTLSRSGGERGKFTWEYDVPSTGYHVHITVEDVAGDTMSTTWKNAYDTGFETLYRLP